MALIDLLLLQQERHLGTRPQSLRGHLRKDAATGHSFRRTSHGITQLFAPFGAQAWAPPLLADAVVDISADSPHG